MRVLLVTFSHLLQPALNSVLNPALEYCAIVVDEPEPAKQIFNQSGLDANLIHPFYELQECISDFYYDFLLCVSDGRRMFDLHKNFKDYGLPKNKFVYIFFTNKNFLIKRALKYYEKCGSEFEMFATGSCHTAMGLDTHRFKHKLFNVASSGQDLYYDYQIAKILVKNNPKMRYALIGLDPYTFHKDISKTYAFNWKLLQYFIALNDLHNFWMTPQQYKNLFRAEYLEQQVFFENIDLNNVNLEKKSLLYIEIDARIETRRKIDLWKNRFHSDTRRENIKILEDYLALCDNNDIIPIIFLPPMTEGYMKYFSKQKLDEFHFLIGEAQKKFPAAIFFDGWKLNNFSDKDFWDSSHLNIRGAAKFSSIFNQFIEKLEAQID